MRFMALGAIQLVRTHKGGERESSRSLRHAYKRRGVDSCKYVRKIFPFCTYSLAPNGRGV